MGPGILISSLTLSYSDEFFLSSLYARPAAVSLLPPSFKRGSSLVLYDCSELSEIGHVLFPVL